MIYKRNKDVTSSWFFSRKQYKKARYRKRAERELQWMDKTYPGWHGYAIL